MLNSFGNLVFVSINYKVEEIDHKSFYSKCFFFSLIKVQLVMPASDYYVFYYQIKISISF